MLLKIQRQNQVQAWFDQGVKTRRAGPGFFFCFKTVARNSWGYLSYHPWNQGALFQSSQKKSWGWWDPLNCLGKFMTVKQRQVVPSDVGLNQAGCHGNRMLWLKPPGTDRSLGDLEGIFTPREQWREARPQAGVFIARNSVITCSTKSEGWKESPVCPGRSVLIHQGFYIPRERRTSRICLCLWPGGEEGGNDLEVSVSLGGRAGHLLVNQRVYLIKEPTQGMNLLHVNPDNSNYSPALGYKSWMRTEDALEFQNKHFTDWVIT